MRASAYHLGLVALAMSLTYWRRHFQTPTNSKGYHLFTETATEILFALLEEGYQFHRRLERLPISRVPPGLHRKMRHLRAPGPTASKFSKPNPMGSIAVMAYGTVGLARCCSIRSRSEPFSSPFPSVPAHPGWSGVGVPHDLSSTLYPFQPARCGWGSCQRQDAALESQDARRWGVFQTDPAELGPFTFFEAIGAWPGGRSQR